MKKIGFLSVLAVAFLSMFSCNGGSTDGESALGDSTAVVQETLEQQEVNDMMALINAVSAGLDSIQIQEKMIYSASEEGASKDKILAQLKSFKELLAQKQAQIDALAKKNAQNESDKQTIKNLQKIVDYLNAQLEEKNTQIAKMQELLQQKDANIDALRYDVNQLTAESDYLKDQNYEQDKQLNTAYYVVGSKKDLKDAGLLTGGFLKKTKVDNEGVDVEKFKKVDIRGFKTLTIDSKSPKLVTGNPESSYTLEKNEDGTSTLTITDAQKFWSVSRYLIIQL